jgi:hypothetical protein
MESGYSLNGWFHGFSVQIAKDHTTLSNIPDMFWLVLWNMFFFYFPYIGNVTNPTDELIFFRGVGLNHQPVLHHFTGNWHLDI